eukprot:4936624-Prymnesium_polylepis.2
MIFIAGLVVGLHDDIATDAAGSPELAHRFLGFRSSEDIVVTMICASFAILVLLVSTLAIEVRLQRMKSYLDGKWSVITMDPPYVKWNPQNVYACFLSHYKMGEHSSPVGVTVHPLSPPPQ